MLARNSAAEEFIEVILSSLPKCEEYKLKDQIMRCSRSVTNNIAEGYGRFSY